MRETLLPHEILEDHVDIQNVDPIGEVVVFGFDINQLVTPGNGVLSEAEEPDPIMEAWVHFFSVTQLLTTTEFGSLLTSQGRKDCLEKLAPLCEILTVAQHQASLGSAVDESVANSFCEFFRSVDNLAAAIATIGDDTDPVQIFRHLSSYLGPIGELHLTLVERLERAR